MNVNGLKANGYGMNYMQQERETQKTGEFASAYAARAAERTAEEKLTEGKSPTQKWNVACSSTNVILHGTDTAEGDEVVTAWANVVTGISMTVYRPQGFDPQNPVYKVKMWDANGKETEYLVDISKVNPSECNVLEMYAYSAHLSSTGECPDALERFLMAQAHHRDSIKNYSAKNLFDTTNWLTVIKEVMQMQYKAGNLKGYMEYKSFLGFLMRKSSGEKGLLDSVKEENRVDTEIQVKPDGSQVLMMTRHIGGMSTTTSVEITKPTKAAGRESVGE